MGLDISFEKEKAVAAGIEFKNIRNGSNENIARQQRTIATCDAEDRAYEQRHLDWLLEEELCIAVPGTGHYVMVYEGATGTFDEDDRFVPEYVSLVVRANKWGNTYDPLTQWLKSHNISWSEF